MTPLEILEMVCSSFGVDPAQALRPGQSGGGAALCRHVAIWLCRRNGVWSLKELGRAFGRDHTTVMAAARRIEARRAKEPRLKRRSDALESRLVRILEERAA